MSTKVFVEALAIPIVWAVGFWYGVQLRTIWPEPVKVG